MYMVSSIDQEFRLIWIILLCLPTTKLEVTTTCYW